SVGRAVRLPRQRRGGRNVRRAVDQALKAKMPSKTILALALSGICVAGCATRPSDSETERAVAEMIKTSLRTRGQATVARLSQDDAQALCSKHAGELPEGVSDGIEKAQQATVR